MQKGEYLQIDTGDVQTIMGVVTQVCTRVSFQHCLPAQFCLRLVQLLFLWN